jgi:hypothetical protein
MATSRFDLPGSTSLTRAFGVLAGVPVADRDRLPAEDGGDIADAVERA